MRNAISGIAKDALPCNREGIDQQNADDEDHGSYKNRDEFGHGCLTQQDTSRSIVLQDRYRDAPPGEGGVEACGEQPCTKQIIHFSRFITSCSIPMMSPPSLV